MKDIPLFTTQYGIASLALQQIPHRSEAYVTIRQAEQPEELLRECVRFCRMCGAERVFAAGHDCTLICILKTARSAAPCLTQADG